MKQARYDGTHLLRAVDANASGRALYDKSP
jgi:hypothetical protein